MIPSLLGFGYILVWLVVGLVPKALVRGFTRTAYRDSALHKTFAPLGMRIRGFIREALPMVVSVLLS